MTVYARYFLLGIWLCIALVHCFCFLFCGVSMVRAGFRLSLAVLVLISALCAFGILTTPIHSHRHGGIWYEQGGMKEIWASLFVHM
jgi:hypothetical protein